MVKPILQIQNNNFPEDFLQCRLMIEVGYNTVGYVLLNLKGMSLVALKYFELHNLKEKSLIEILQDIIDEDEFLQKNVSETFFVYNFPDSSLMPEKFFNTENNKSITEIIYGNLNRGLVLNEKIPWWELYNVYRVPADVHNFLQQKFTAGKYWHKYSLLLKSYKMFNAREYDNFLKVSFYSDKMIVVVFKKRRLQLIQTFAFHDSIDVVYHLLNCCNQFKITPEEAVLQVSGLIDRQSTLYDELLKYFLHFLFDDTDDSIKIADEIKDQYPLHYFSSFLKMAVCV
jgi:hypothetical protein